MKSAAWNAIHSKLTPRGHKPTRSNSSIRALVALLVCFVVVCPQLSAASGDFFVTGGSDRVVRIDGMTGANLGLFAQVGGRPYGTICAPNGNVLVSRQDGGNIVEVDSATGAFVRVFAGLLSLPTGMAVGPDRNVYGSVAGTDAVLKFDGATGALIGTFAAGLRQPHGLAFGPNGDLFVAVNDGTVVQLNGTTGAVQQVLRTSGVPRELAFGLQGDLYVSVIVSNTVERFDVETGQLVETLSGGLINPHGLRFDSDGDLFVVNFNSANIVRYDNSLSSFTAFGSAGFSFPIGLMIGTESGPCPPPSVEPPSVYEVTANPNPVSVAGSIALSATIDDTEAGGAIIRSAEYEIRDADGAVVASGVGDDANCPSPDYLCPVDGTGMPDPAPTPFNSVVEQVKVTVPAGIVATLGPGVYEACVRGTDADGNRSDYDQEGACAFLVIYDPDAGFVTGGGWIDSPSGALVSSPESSGRANFGFISKYKKGAATPTGQTQFQFKAGDLNFHSSSYQWLVIAGPLAQYKGVGAINGGGDYGFLLTAKDSALNGGPPHDAFRIKIWEKASEMIVYDNGSNQPIDGGSILIHK